MFFSKISAFGLDLSDLSIKIVWLKKNGASIQLASFAREEIPENVIESGTIKKEDELVELIKQTVSQAKREKIKTKYCIVSLPETESYLRVVQLPKMKKEELAEAIKWEVEANIPFSLEDVYFDWQVIKRDLAPSDRLDILIGALPKALVDPYLGVIKKTGLKPLIFEIESLATARALIKKDYWTEPVMIIDLGAKRTSFIFFAGSTVWLTSSLPISNNLLNNDIAQALNISYPKAKALKFKIGLDLFKEEGKVFRAMEPRLLELVAEIKKYLNYYQTSFSSKQTKKMAVNKILLCGGGANLKGLPGFLSSEIKIKVAIGDPWINILNSSAKELPGLSFSDSLAFTTALGLGLRGLEISKIDYK